MDQDALDRICADLREKRNMLGEPGAEMARLRRDGHSTVESMYIISKVFEIPLSATKELAMTRGSGGHDDHIEDFHNEAEDHFRR